MTEHIPILKNDQNSFYVRAFKTGKNSLKGASIFSVIYPKESEDGIYFFWMSSDRGQVNFTRGL